MPPADERAGLRGRVAIVTGSGGGIGREHAVQLAQHGVSVLVNDTGLRKGADAAGVVAEIEKAGGTAVANTDSATWDGAPAIVAAAIEAFGRIDILVNNATAGGSNDLWRFTEDEWDRTVNVNFKGYFAMIRAVAPHLCRQGSGVIVNTSSGAGFGLPGNVAYASSKEGVVGLTRTVAREIGRFGVRCNAIRPLAVGQSMADYGAAMRRWDALLALTTGPKPGVPFDARFDPNEYATNKISPFVIWLCTEAAKGVNGRTFNVGGDVLSMLSEPAPERNYYQPGGWDVAGLLAAADAITLGLENGYALDGYPELQRFEE
jgi:3-oxoacyl-[acyl-carrier protein] reductase